MNDKILDKYRSFTDYYTRCTISHSIIFVALFFVLVYVSFMLKIDNKYIVILFLISAALIYKKYLAIYVLITAILIWMRGDASSFYMMIGDPSSYTLDGLANYYGNNNSQLHFPPMASVLSLLGIQYFGESNSSYMFQILATTSSILLYFVLTNFGLKKLHSLLLSMVFLLSPLVIWYSKSTYSELIFLTIILAVTSMLQNRKKNSDIIVAIGLSLLIFLAIQTRITGLIIAFLIIFIASYRSTFRNNNYILTLIFGAVVSFSVLYLYRYNYTWNWQLSHYFKSLGPTPTYWLIVTLIMISGISGKGLSILETRYKNLRGKVIFIPIFLILLDSFIYIISSKTYLSTAFYSYHFGLVLIPVLIAGIFYGVKLAKHRIDILFLICSLALFGLLLPVRHVSTDSGHAFWLYWHRYYFSETYLLHFIFTALGFYYLYKNYLINYHKKWSYIVILFIPLFTVDKIYVAITNSMFTNTLSELDKLEVIQPKYYLLSDNVVYYYSPRQLISPYFAAKSIAFKQIDLFKRDIYNNGVNIYPGSNSMVCISNKIEECDLGYYYVKNLSDRLTFRSVAHVNGGRTMASTHEFKLNYITLVPAIDVIVNGSKENIISVALKLNSSLINISDKNAKVIIKFKIETPFEGSIYRYINGKHTILNNINQDELYLNDIHGDLELIYQIKSKLKRTDISNKVSIESITVK